MENPSNMIPSTIISVGSNLMGNVPTPEAADQGNVLTAGANGSYDWDPIPSTNEVPAVSSGDNGKVLMASYTPAAGDDPAVAEYSWESIPAQIPAFDPVEDAGKVLAIKSDGSGLEWISLT